MKWLFLIVVVSFLGCGPSGSSDRPPTYAVTGVVTLNGKPVEGAVVTFQPMEGKGSAVGSSDATGKYVLSTYSSNDGAQAGQYKVSIAKYEAAAAPTSAPPPGQIGAPGLDDSYAPPTSGGGKASTGPKNLLPAKYANVETSALRAMVEKSANKFDFDLK